MTHPTDPQHQRKPAFDRPHGTFGQEYTLDQEKKLAEEMPAGSVAPKPPQAGYDDPALPPDNGRRASFDPATGEVHGSGAGAGGGNPGEDPEDDRAGGSGTPLTGPTGARDD